MIDLLKGYFKIGDRDDHREMRAAVVAAIERLHADRLVEHVARLAHHERQGVHALALQVVANQYLGRAVNPSGSRFCNGCGAKLGDPAPAEPEPRFTSESYTLKHLDHDLQGRPRG